MPNLKCNKYSCKNNHCNRCELTSIMVSRDALCSDYEKKMQETNQNMEYEFAYDRCMSSNQGECDIKCEDYACLHNASGECAAQFIRIDDCGDEAKCCQVREER